MFAAVRKSTIWQLYNFVTSNMIKKISGVTGAGFSNPKLGDAVWPQLNEMLIIYCQKEEAEKIVELVKEIREKYPMEGIACFVSKAAVR